MHSFLRNFSNCLSIPGWCRCFWGLFWFKTSSKCRLDFLCFFVYRLAFFSSCWNQIWFLRKVKKLLVFIHFFFIIQRIYFLKPSQMLHFILLSFRMSLFPFHIFLLVGQFDFFSSDNSLLASFPSLLDNIVFGLHVDIHQDERVTNIVSFNNIIERGVSCKRRSMIDLK